MLFTIDEIRTRLDEQFLPLEPLITGFRLVNSSMDTDMIDSLEASLSTTFPNNYKELITQYNFGKLTIGPVVFGNAGDFCEIIKKYNLSSETIWWTGGSRPEYIVMIANSDPYAICLNCKTGQILAFLHEHSLNESVIISSSFDLFLRGIGTIFFLRTEVQNRQNLALQVIHETSSQDKKFWIQLAD